MGCGVRVGCLWERKIVRKVSGVDILRNQTYFCEKVIQKIFSIKVETTEDLKIVEPMLALLRKTKAEVSVKGSGELAGDRKKAMLRLIKFINESGFPVVSKIEIPNREERNACR
ncbi:MAG: hypothetical protein EPGJADBJ_03679 [Saprospiraceae bacterium]|nr:hypothetical protein [Saprospiraceae bacterium]